MRYNLFKSPAVVCKSLILPFHDFHNNLEGIPPSWLRFTMMAYKNILSQHRFLHYPVPAYMRTEIENQKTDT
jgi:hypothetical protein